MNDTPTPVLWLDLDGTVRHGKDELGHFVNNAADVVVFPEAVQMMRRAYRETPEQRWERMRKWVQSKIKPEEVKAESGGV